MRSQAEIDGGNHYAAGCQCPVHHLIAGKVTPVPGPTVDIKQRREGTVSLGLVNAYGPGLLTVVAVFLVNDIYFYLS